MDQEKLCHSEICFLLLSWSFSLLLNNFAFFYRNTDFEIVRVVGTNSLAPFATQPANCSARDLITIRGQGCLYLRLKATQTNQVNFIHIYFVYWYYNHHNT